MRTEVYEVSTVLGLCTILATLERLAAPGTKRVLIVSINSLYPEVDSWYRASPKIQQIARTRFDRVIELNDEIFPIHPNHWRFERGWIAHRRRWLNLIGAGHVDVLYLESIQAPASRSLARLFPEAEIRVYSDGLMVYGPTRTPLAKDIQRRISELIYVDYLEGSPPLLLEEASPRLTSLSIDELRPHFTAMRESPAIHHIGDAGAKAVYLGQTLAQTKLMSADEEATLYSRGLEKLARVFGPSNIGFKPHISASSSVTLQVWRNFRSATGRDLRLIDGQRPIESVLNSGETKIIAGAFSTALFTVATLYGIPAFTHGTKEILYRLCPHKNSSNRIPLIAADILLPNIRALLEAFGSELDEQTTITAARRLALSARGNAEEFRAAQLIVGYYMQPKTLAHRKPAVEQLVRNSLVRHLDLYLLGLDSKTTPKQGAIASAVKETVQWFARIALDERKAYKLEHDPERFFRDSRVPGASLAGRAYRRLVR